MTMFGKFIKAVIVLWTVAALSLSAETVVFGDKFYR